MTASSFARNAAAAAFVLLLHVGALWAFNHGLTHKPAAKPPEVIVMAQLIAPEPLPLGEEGEAPAGTPDEPPAAQPAPPPPPPKEKPKPRPRAPKPKPRPVARPELRPEPVREPAPLAVADSEAARAANAPAVAAAPPAPPAPPAPAESANSAGAHHAAAHHHGTGTGSGTGGGGGSGGHGQGRHGSGSGGGGGGASSACTGYLHNPKPKYPSISLRLGESGRSVVSVLVGADGSAKKVRLQRSSGYDRLDQAALDAVRRWRFVPGSRGGVPEDTWCNAPIVWQPI